MKNIPSLKNSTELKKILKCVFDLTDLEANIILMLPLEGMRVRDPRYPCERQNNYPKSLKNLVKKELVLENLNVVFKEKEEVLCLQISRTRSN